MDAKAIGRYLRVPPRKARLVLDTVRGKSAQDALATLKFIPNRAARYIERLVESAVANAVNNYSMDRDVLRLSGAYVDQGPTLKRIQPRAMGRAYRIVKRTSHITVLVSEDEALRKEVAATKAKTKAKGRKPARAKTEPAAPKAAAPKRVPKEKKAEKKTEASAAQGETTPDAVEE
ncbi:MAG: 50S ribosomal protein L22 [Armatimonadetes bacterium]|nr:50S ribosomal protein L22 [Armatimonadota bacterium]